MPAGGRRSRSALTRWHAGQVLMNFSAAAGRPGGPTTPSRGAQGGHRIQVAAHWQRRRATDKTRRKQTK